MLTVSWRRASSTKSTLLSVYLLQSEWFDLTDKELLEVISKISSLGFPEYIEPETAKVIEYKPHYKVVNTLPYEQNKYAHVTYFSAWVLALVIGLLLCMSF